MNKGLFAVITLTVAIASFAIGSQWNSRFAQSSASAPATVKARSKTEVLPFDYQAPEPTISTSAAKGHRENHYEDMRSVDNVLELPTDFAQSEALYIVAGRSNASELEQLIHQSIDIADRYDRVAALEILFSRYVELDPNAAVDFLLMIDLDVDSRIISSVFHSWAKMDTNSAIAMANSIVNIRQRKIAGNAILSSTARTDPGMLEAVESQLADRHNLEYMKSEAIGIRANYDPETALQEALGLKNRNGRWAAIQRVGIVWARNDPVTAVSYAQNITDVRLRGQFISSVLDRWIGDDPDTAIQSILAIPNLQERNQYLQGALTSYGRNDPKNALLLASQLSGQAKSMVYQSIYSEWASKDPEAAMQELAAMENSPDKRNLLGHIGQGLASVDPDAALRWANTLDAEQRAIHLPNILGQMAQSDPQRALEAALAMGSAGSQSALSRVLQYVGHSNPQLAMQYVSELPAGRARDSLYTSIAEGLARSDPQAAIAWASTLSGQAYVRVISGLAGVMAESDPDQAASMVGQVPAEARGALIKGISSTIANNDPYLALTWLSRFKNDPGYDQAAGRIAMNLVHRDPQYAIRIADGLGSEQRQQAMRGVLSIWAMSDPVSASRWAAGRDGDKRTEAVSSVAQIWAGREPLAASRWVRSLRSGETKDRALTGLVSSGGFDTRETLDLINSIESDTQRDQAITSAYMRLRHQNNDDKAANELLDRVDASDSVRQLLQSSGG